MHIIIILMKPQALKHVVHLTKSSHSGSVWALCVCL